MRLSDKIVKLRKTNECLFDDEAICFYKPFPLQKLTVSTLIRYIAECLDKADIALVVLSAFLVSLVGLLLPRLNSLLFVRVIASGSIRVLLAISMFMINGIQEIELSEPEKRAYARWSDLYAKLVAITYHPPLFLRLNTVISTAISLFGTLMSILWPCKAAFLFRIIMPSMRRTAWSAVRLCPWRAAPDDCPCHCPEA